jgi:hypothetical protein
MPEEAFEHRLDLRRLPERALDPRPPAPKAEHDEVADRRVARALAVDDDRDAALEEWVAHEELAPAGELRDEDVH